MKRVHSAIMLPKFSGRTFFVKKLRKNQLTCLTIGTKIAKNILKIPKDSKQNYICTKSLGNGLSENVATVWNLSGFKNKINLYFVLIFPFPRKSQLFFGQSLKFYAKRPKKGPFYDHFFIF